MTKGNKKSSKTLEMENSAPVQELEKGKTHIIVEIIEYVPNAIVSKTIIKKTTGNITVSSFDAGEELGEKTIPFDNYIQIIDGTAEIVIGKKKLRLGLGKELLYRHAQVIASMRMSSSK